MRRRALVAMLAVACAALLPVAGCSLILGVDGWQDVSCVADCGVDSASDTIEPLEGGPEGAIDAPILVDADANDTAVVTGDASDAADAPPVNPYNPISDLTKWSKFDVGTLGTGGKDFAGGAFDGQYVYFSPYSSGTPDSVVARFDTAAGAGFGSATSWQTYDTGGLDAGARAFLGSVFDPTHKQLYLVPGNGGSPASVVASYATSKTFTQAGSWATESVPAVPEGGVPSGFAGGTFDGQYVYLAPYNSGAPDGLVARVDTRQPFTSAASWSQFAVTQVLPAAKGYVGAVYTGTFVLFVPSGGSTPSGVVAAYDTTLPFGTPTSWLTFDLSGLNAFARGFHGGAFDGQYVYLAPYNNGSLDGTVARFDSTHQVTDPAGWTFFDATTIDAKAMGFWGAAFDGRYVYFVPNAGSVVARFDTTASFGTATSWSTFDTSSLGAGVGQFAGAVFDGEYLYLAPATSGVVVRFDARSPPALPAGQSGSFF